LPVYNGGMDKPSRLLVLSDHPTLARVIEVNLRDRWGVISLVLLDEDGPLEIPPIPTEFSLIIIGLSAASGEPLVILSRASLTPYIRQIPILIVSDRSFQSQIDDLIWHLDYPFNSDELRQKVQSILSRGASIKSQNWLHSGAPEIPSP
jgi:hypothetical protein